MGDEKSPQSGLSTKIMALKAAILFALLRISLVTALPAPQSDTSVQNAPWFRSAKNRNWNDEADPTLTADLFEGDIALTAATWNSRRDQKYRWQNGKIPYHISKDFEGMVWTKRMIKQAISRLEERTRVGSKPCLQFVEYTPKEGDDTDYINLIQAGGCWSHVWRQGVNFDPNDTGRQNLSLANGCWSAGTIMHEFLHAAGFWHEQSRTDRDDYVTINWENIPKDKHHNFLKYTFKETDDLNRPYDYGSVMHYGGYGFAIDKNVPTIIPRDPKAKIGQRTHLSANDIKEIQLYYGCLENMGPWGCDFEEGANGGLCKGWRQEPFDDDFDWTIAQGMTMSSGMGPTNDHTFGSWHGHFAYIEATDAKAGTKATLVSPKVRGVSCLSFWYNMYGPNIATLEVTHRSHGRDFLIFTASGSQGMDWRQKRLTIGDDGEYELRSTASKGDGNLGDIAIDDVKITSGHC